MMIMGQEKMDQRLVTFIYPIAEFYSHSFQRFSYPITSIMECFSGVHLRLQLIHPFSIPYNVFVIVLTPLNNGTSWVVECLKCSYTRIQGYYRAFHINVNLVFGDIFRGQWDAEIVMTRAGSSESTIMVKGWR